MARAETEGHLKIGSWKLVIGHSGLFKGAEVGGINKFIRSKSSCGDKLYEYDKIRNNRSRRLGKEPA